MEVGAASVPVPRETTPAGIGAAATSVTVWGLGPVVLRNVELPGLVTAFHRLWLGTAVAMALLVARRERITARTLRLSARGGIAFGLDILLFFEAVKRTTVTNAAVIAALQPALVLLVAGRMFGERVRGRDIALTGFAIAGVGLVVQGAAGGGGDLTGDLLATASVLAWAWYFVASKRAREQLGALEYQAGLSIVATAVVLPVVLFAERGVPFASASDWAWLMVMVVGPGGGHLLMNWAHNHTTITLTSLLTLASPVVSAVAAAIFLDERVSAVQILGMVIVLASLAAVVARGRR
jgi:drug/metabolite transporter (DMT)-like permease